MKYISYVAEIGSLTIEYNSKESTLKISNIHEFEVEALLPVIEAQQAGDFSAPGSFKEEPTYDQLLDEILDVTHWTPSLENRYRGLINHNTKLRPFEKKDLLEQLKGWAAPFREEKAPRQPQTVVNSPSAFENLQLAIDDAGGLQQLNELVSRVHDAPMIPEERSFLLKKIDSRVAYLTKEAEPPHEILLPINLDVTTPALQIQLPVVIERPPSPPLAFPAAVEPPSIWGQMTISAPERDEEAEYKQAGEDLAQVVDKSTLATPVPAAQPAPAEESDAAEPEFIKCDGDDCKESVPSGDIVFEATFPHRSLCPKCAEQSSKDHERLEQLKAELAPAAPTPQQAFSQDIATLNAEIRTVNLADTAAIPVEAEMDRAAAWSADLERKLQEGPPKPLFDEADAEAPKNEFMRDIYLTLKNAIRDSGELSLEEGAAYKKRIKEWEGMQGATQEQSAALSTLLIPKLSTLVPKATKAAPGPTQAISVQAGDKPRRGRPPLLKKSPPQANGDEPRKAESAPEATSAPAPAVKEKGTAPTDDELLKHDTVRAVVHALMSAGQTDEADLIDRVKAITPRSLALQKVRGIEDRVRAAIQTFAG